MMRETWETSHAYEQFIGRWSRRLAAEFLSWLGAHSSLIWGDIGCGTGALVGSILALPRTKSVMAVDRSKSFLAEARSRISNQQAHFAIADALALPWAAASLDTAVSGLVLNFVPDAERMIREMARVTRPGGRVAVYVWDYRDGMQMLRHFWDVVVELNPQDVIFDEADRFPLCQPEPLRALLQNSGLSAVRVTEISIPTVFRDFADYWQPFLGGHGPAQAYLAALDEPSRERIREGLRERMVPAADGSITLSARAWAVQGVVLHSAESSRI